MSIIRYALSDSAVVFNNQVNEIRIRKGVWNYEEAILSLEAESEAVKDLVLPSSAIWMLERQWILMSICKIQYFFSRKGRNIEYGNRTQGTVLYC